MKMSIRLAAAILGAALLVPAGRTRAATVGAEWATWDTNGDPKLPNAYGNARDFYNVMGSFGHTKKFLSGDSNFWTGDLADPQVSGAWDPYFADNVNVYLFETHGASDATAYYYSPGHNNAVNGVTTSIAGTNIGGTQWTRLGNKNARIVSMITCHGLELSDLAHWDPVADGIHMLTGGSGLMYDYAGRGSSYAFWGNIGFFGSPMLTVKQAWFNAAGGGETPVVMAYGVNAQDAFNRRDNEKFNWSMARLGPRTYRAWSWISK